MGGAGPWFQTETGAMPPRCDLRVLDPKQQWVGIEIQHEVNAKYAGEA